VYGKEKDNDMKKPPPIIGTQNTADFPVEVVASILDATNPSVAAARALDGKIFAMLDADERRVLDFYRDQGRKFGVSVSIINKADPELLSRATSQEQADQIMKTANSVVSVTVAAGYEKTMNPNSGIDFTPTFHAQNSQGNWQMKPIDPRLIGAAADEAKRIVQSGQTVVALDSDDTGFRPTWATPKE
jgi:hypothetical protein